MTSADLELIAGRLVTVAERLEQLVADRSPGAVDPRALAADVAVVARSAAALARHARAELLHG